MSDQNNIKKIQRVYHMFKNLGNIVQQAKQVKENLGKAEEELTNTYVTGSSASNMCKLL